MADMSKMAAIVTTYAGPTNTRGSRIIATVPVNSDRPGQRVTRSYDHRLNSEQNHAAAAQALADKMEWSGRLLGGALKKGYAFVFVK